MNVNRYQRWIKIALLSMALAASPFAFFGVLAWGSLTACDYTSAKMQKTLNTVNIGDTKDSVISKMGTARIERGNALRISSPDCKGACVERLWFDSPCAENWFVDLDKNNTVLYKGHLISP